VIFFIDIDYILYISLSVCCNVSVQYEAECVKVSHELIYLFIVSFIYLFIYLLFYSFIYSLFFLNSIFMDYLNWLFCRLWIRGRHVGSRCDHIYSPVWLPAISQSRQKPDGTFRVYQSRRI